MLVLAQSEGLALSQASDPSDHWLRLQKVATGPDAAQQEVRLRRNAQAMRLTKDAGCALQTAGQVYDLGGDAMHLRDQTEAV